MSKPQGNVKANMISIRETLEKDKESNQQVRQEDLPREGFHLDHVKMYWKQFAFQVKEDGMETFYNALIKRDPVLRGEETLELTVDNLVQQNYIQTHLLTFKEFMRKQLGNYYLDIVLVQAAADEEEVKFLTGKDKFAALARKNPNLHTLKNRFNLDIDYWCWPTGNLQHPILFLKKKHNNFCSSGKRKPTLKYRVPAPLAHLRFSDLATGKCCILQRQVLRH